MERMLEQPKPPSMRGLLRVLKVALRRIADSDGDWFAAIDDLERAIKRVERYLKAHD